MKYQFTIRINNNKTNNSAATKALTDCNKLLLQKGYEDYSLYVHNSSNRLQYGFFLFISIFKFYFEIKKDSVIAIQYPLLNNIFKYFIKAAKLKNAKIFCVIHDIEALRLGGRDKELVRVELNNLNYYDCLIVHNNEMQQWLRNNGVSTKMVSLVTFDYLLEKKESEITSTYFSKTIVFAGNLEKSTFIYSLSAINTWKFNVYGPNFLPDKNISNNVVWRGVFSPEEVAYKLQGDFGLIWDGDVIEQCDEVFGNYLKYNNPHKFSLYISAGLPVIAPKNSAIGKIIKENQIGILIENLHELKTITITEIEYANFKDNCKLMREKVISGHHFLNAIEKTEEVLAAV